MLTTMQTSVSADERPQMCLSLTCPPLLLKLFGDWVLFWVVDETSSLFSTGMMANLVTHYIKLRLLPDNNTVELKGGYQFQ